MLNTNLTFNIIIYISIDNKLLFLQLKTKKYEAILTTEIVFFNNM